MTDASHASAPALEIADLRLRRSGQIILHTADWTVDRGRHGLVLGPSGCGKTTLLHLIAGLEQPDSGRLRVLGRDIDTLPNREMDHFRALHIGLIFQDFHLLPGLTVRDNLRLPRWLAGRDSDTALLAHLLEELQITQLADTLPHRLSQGEKQRVAIARSLVNQPELILADEPTSALDDDNAERVLALLLHQAAANGASLLIATHDRRITAHFDDVLQLAMAEVAA